MIIPAISMDLPFAWKRWCPGDGVGRVQTLPDHRDAYFGRSFGVLIKEPGLLARAVFLVDQERIIQCIQIIN
jgi:thiol peroxidase